MKLKMKSPASVTLALLLPMIVLTGCVSATRDVAATQRLYQPSILRLNPGQEIQTQDGLYRPQTPEVWHSDNRYRQLERAYLDQLSALQTRQLSTR
jgi:hypothetical protein